MAGMMAMMHMTWREERPAAAPCRGADCLPQAELKITDAQMPQWKPKKPAEAAPSLRGWRNAHGRRSYERRVKLLTAGPAERRSGEGGRGRDHTNARCRMRVAPRAEQGGEVGARHKGEAHSGTKCAQVRVRAGFQHQNVIEVAQLSRSAVRMGLQCGMGGDVVRLAGEPVVGGRRRIGCCAGLANSSGQNAPRSMISSAGM